MTTQKGALSSVPLMEGRPDVSCILFALHEMPRTIRERTVAEMSPCCSAP
jgi:hypothetical protein